MILFHGRWSRRTSLLAAGALDEVERAVTLAHVLGCAACRTELAAARDAVALVEADPIQSARPALPLPALVARVQARISEAERAGRPRGVRGTILAPLVAAAAVVIVLLSLRSQSRPPVAPPSAAPQAAVSDESLSRIEASMARENAVRYLSDAQDVLVTVAAAPLACDRKRAHVDVGEEARRSRELLSRGALLLDTDRAEMAGVRPVLDDVSDTLREVAALDPCSRPEELLAIQRQMSRQRLLMKIDLMTRELQG